MASKKRKLEDVVASTTVWALVFPDGHVSGQWFYDSRKDLKQFAPGALYGDNSVWARAHNEGYRARKLYLSLTPATGAAQPVRHAVAKKTPARTKGSVAPRKEPARQAARATAAASSKKPAKAPSKKTR